MGEVGHFIVWLEINKKVSVNLIGKLKSKYGVSATNPQNGNITDTQPVINVSKISTPIPTQQAQPTDSGPQPTTSSAAPLQQLPVSNGTNNNFQQKKQINQPPIVGNPKRNSPQKQASGISSRGWTIIGLALLFGAVGATLAAIGIIPEITAIGLIATAVLLGIVGAALGCIVGYLTDITVNKCCNSEMKAA